MSSQIEALQTQTVDYGIDAPGVRRGMLIAGASGTVLAVAAALAQPLGLVAPGIALRVTFGLVVVGALAAVYGFFMGGYMTHASRIGKLRTRDRLLDEVAALRPWQGNEAVLDVGCGRGLMLLGAAKRLSAAKSGKAVGIDLWRAEDQTANTPNAAMENARIEAVADRVRVDTGDARALPYPDGSFDVVLSHWVVHNVESAEDRLTILDEMPRVLRPGGVIALADIAHIKQYQAHFELRKIAQIRLLDGGLHASLMGVLSGGSFRPQALLARRL